MSRVRIAVQGIVEVDVESEELKFSDLKKEAFKIFKFAKNNMLGTKPCDNDVLQIDYTVNLEGDLIFHHCDRYYFTNDVKGFFNIKTSPYGQKSD